MISVAAAPPILAAPPGVLALIVVGIFLVGRYLMPQWGLQTGDLVKLSLFTVFGYAFFHVVGSMMYLGGTLFGYMGMVVCLLAGILALHIFHRAR